MTVLAINNPAAVIKEQLRVSVGQCSSAGCKKINQDFCSLHIPTEPLLSVKGIALAIADGISSSDVSHIASETAVVSFLEDYYCTPDTWSIKKSAHRVLSATNNWLRAQSRQGAAQGDNDRGYLCTFSALIIKSMSAHIMHVGDTRIYRMRSQQLEQITTDHRVKISHQKSYLGRALGLDSHVEIDYHSLPLQQGDAFFLATDGIYEFVSEQFLRETLTEYKSDPERGAEVLVAHALANGSDDNLSVQLLYVEQLPAPSESEVRYYSRSMPCPPLLSEGEEFDGFLIVKQLSANHRSHVYLAKELLTGAYLVLKIPSLDLRHDPMYLERLMLEEWIAKRIHSRHVVKAFVKSSGKNFIYTTAEYIEGQTLAAWVKQNPTPSLDVVSALVEQVVRGLQAFHRHEILHQDVRPENIIIDNQGVVKIIDMGSAKVLSLGESDGAIFSPEFPGTLQYMAPEYFYGGQESYASDIYSVGVLFYYLLSGGFPYGLSVAKVRYASQANKLTYKPLRSLREDMPASIDAILKKATNPNPDKRFPVLSEFTHAINHPYGKEWQMTYVPLAERNPLLFWQSATCFLVVVVIILMAGVV